MGRAYGQTGVLHLRRRLLPDGKALTPRVVELLRGDHTNGDYAALIGVTERTVRRWLDGGATLHAALAMAGAELERGNLRRASYVLEMIGNTRILAPDWDADREGEAAEARRRRGGAR